MDFGTIGNGQSIAVIDKQAAITWCCLPDFDSPSIFASLLDDQKKGGICQISPTPKVGKPYEVYQSYERNTNILRTTFHNDEYEFSVIDFMPRWTLEGNEGFHCPPQVIRMIDVVRGTPRLKVTYDPVLDYGRTKTKTKWTLDEGMAVSITENQVIYLNTNIPLELIQHGESIVAQQGNPLCLVISYNAPAAKPTLANALRAHQRTCNYWRRWTKHCYLPCEYQPEVIRSALTLKQFIFQKTGASIAAATTSIPEIIGSNRTWDYRYCWLRDSFFVIQALMELSHFEEIEGFIQYLKEIMARYGEDLTIHPLFTIYGERVPREEFLDHWSGFKGSKPVRVGNDATDHDQHDVYGEMVLSLYPILMDERFVRDDLDELWSIVKRLVDLSIANLDEPDNGIWEFRENPRHFTFSKLLCWAAVDRGMKIAYKLGKDDPVHRWKKERKRMRQEILEKSWSETAQAFTQSYGCDNLDASNLLMPVLGLIDAKDPRMVSTIEQTEDKLMRNGLLFRYTNEDDFGTPENAFTICTFWLIDALILSGQKRKARKYFENILEYGNHLGLFSEDINPVSGEQTGNFPQGYTHMAIIRSACLLAER